MAYATLRGLPESRNDYRIGTLAALLANIHRTEGAELLGPGDIIKSLAPDTEERAAAAGTEPEPLDAKAASDALRRMLGRHDGDR